MGKKIMLNTLLLTEDYFNDKKVDGVLYGILLGLADKGEDGSSSIKKTSMPTKGSFCEWLKIKSPMTYDAHLSYLIEKGYIKDLGEYYYFPKQKKFSMYVPKETIRFLEDCCGKHVLQIYFYLGEKYRDAVKEMVRYHIDIDALVEYTKLTGERKHAVAANAVTLLECCGLIEVDEHGLCDFKFQIRETRKKDV